MFNENTILGIDLGTNSLGWALLEYDSNKKSPTGIIDSGVRIFEAGMDGDITKGRATSRCATRRTARSIRRNTARKSRRMKKLQHLLQKYGLLPKGDDIEEIIIALDQRVRKFCNSIPEDKRPSYEILAHTYPYYLRCLALDCVLDPFLLGRAIYHLAQRRGFWSNRKSLVDDETGKVKQGISELRKRMVEAQARTLGEYFAFINPTVSRIRSLWTARSMYKGEFDLIMDNHKNLLNTEQIARLKKAIFYQRKLKSTKSLIGYCIFEGNKSRCPWYIPEAQEFRILQSINNLRLIEPDGVLRELTSEEWDHLRSMLMGETGDLDKKGNLSIKKARKILRLPKGSKFTIEDGGEKTFKGNRTLSNLIQVFEDSWYEYSSDDQARIIHDLRCFEKKEPLVKRAVKVWNLSDEKAEAFADIRLEDDYCNVSLKAINKLLPFLREGYAYSQAVKEVYPDAFKSDGLVYEYLPMLDTSSINLRNPVVERCLNELRQVVNSIIRKHGKPGIVRVELAREIKKSIKEKKRIIERNRDLENQRKQARKKIADVFPEMKISRDDVTKVLLAEECSWKCSYTGKSISISSLLGSHPQFDIEHIIPRSRSLDDSYINKTLCYNEENRNVKKNRTPYEAYYGTAKYDEILNRVRKFTGHLKTVKLKHFMMTPEDVEREFTDFSNRQLNDTRYASKEAAAYLGMLYGGVISSIDGKKRVQVLSGGLTAKIRSAYNMNGILNDGDTKSRDDHRHHAVDAIAIGMTSPGTVKKLTEIAKNLEYKSDYIHFSTGLGIKPITWDSFDIDVREKIGKIKASHRISKKIRGSFHKDTFYSKEHEHEVKGKASSYRHVRTNLKELEKREIGKIVDRGIREAVENKLAELGIDDPKKVFRNGENLPELISKDGKTQIPIHKVKLLRKQKTIKVGEGRSKRNVVPGNNHHMMVYAVLDDNGNEKKWDAEVVTMLEARRRLLNGEPVINRIDTDKMKFKMSIQSGDIFEMDFKGNKEFVIVRTIPQTKQIEFARVNDARMKKDIKKSGDWFSKVPNTLRTSNLVKYTITPLGELRWSNA